MQNVNSGETFVESRICRPSYLWSTMNLRMFFTFSIMISCFCLKYQSWSCRFLCSHSFLVSGQTGNGLWILTLSSPLASRSEHRQWPSGTRGQSVSLKKRSFFPRKLYLHLTGKLRKREVWLQRPTELLNDVLWLVSDQQGALVTNCGGWRTALLLLLKFIVYGLETSPHTALYSSSQLVSLTDWTQRGQRSWV